MGQVPPTCRREEAHQAPSYSGAALLGVVSHRASLRAPARGGEEKTSERFKTRASERSQGSTVLADGANGGAAALRTLFGTGLTLASHGSVPLGIESDGARPLATVVAGQVERALALAHAHSVTGCFLDCL